jgi:Dolichol kinase
MTVGSIAKLFSNYTSITISPLWNNVLSSLLTVVYAKGLLSVASFIRQRMRCGYETRKFVHVGAACWIFFWPMFDTSHWSWRLNIIVPTVMSIKLFYKGAILADPNDIDVRILSRSSSPSELLWGPLHFILFMMWVGTQQFMTKEGAILVAALGIGDGIAPIVGKYYGNLKYRLPLGGQKSIEGSLFGVFLGSIVGCYAFIHALDLQSSHMNRIVATAAIATFAEAIAPGNCDNFFIPLMIHFSIQRYPWLIE